MAEAIVIERPKLGSYRSWSGRLRILRRKDGVRCLQQEFVVTDLDREAGEQISYEWVDVPNVNEGQE